MYFLFKMGIFHCYVCLPEGKLVWEKKRMGNIEKKMDIL